MTTYNHSIWYTSLAICLVSICLTLFFTLSTNCLCFDLLTIDSIIQTEVLFPLVSRYGPAGGSVDPGSRPTCPGVGGIIGIWYKSITYCSACGGVFRFFYRKHTLMLQKNRLIIFPCLRSCVSFRWCKCHQVWDWLAVISRCDNLALLTSWLGVST